MWRQGALFACTRARSLDRVHTPGVRDLGTIYASLNDSAGRLKIYAKLFLTGKHTWPKCTSREFIESIYVKFRGATCLSEELDRLKKKKNAWESSRFECLQDRSAILNLLTVRVVALNRYIKKLRTS